MTYKSICPICKQENRCAIEQGKSIDECWCSVQKIDNAILSTVNSPEGLACICSSCASNAANIKDINK